MLELLVCHWLTRDLVQPNMGNPVPQVAYVQVPSGKGFSVNGFCGGISMFMAHDGIKRLKVRNAAGKVIYTYGRWLRL